MPTATSSASKSTPVPAGTYLGICYGVIDIGTSSQPGNFPARRKVMLLFELPHERGVFNIDGKEQDRARVISAEYTLSTDKKGNLRKQLAAWRGRDFTEEEAKAFDVSKVCGHPALVSVVQKPSADGTRMYSNISALMKPMHGTTVPPLENPRIIFDLPKAGPVNIPTTFPEWIVNKIKNSVEYHELTNPQPIAKKPGELTDAQAANLSDNPDLESVPF